MERDREKKIEIKVLRVEGPGETIKNPAFDDVEDI